MTDYENNKIKLYKIFIRVIKDTGLYTTFKRISKRYRMTKTYYESKLIRNGLIETLEEAMQDAHGYNTELIPNITNIISKEIIRDTFIQFLKNKCITSKYVNYLDIPFINNEARPNTPINFLPKHNEIETINIIIDNLLPTQFFFNAFTWRDTPENFDFWNGIHRQWIKTFESLLMELYDGTNK